MKAVLHYVFLVGIPVIVVYMILHVGERNLIAPMNVHGNWLMTFSLPSPESSCQNLYLAYEDPILNISQSGSHLMLFFDDAHRTTFKGNLSQNMIVAHSQDVSGASTPSLSLSVIVDREVEPDQLSGTLVAEACGETWAFTATRQPILDQISTGGH